MRSVDSRADPAERAQREIVGRETLEVARQRTRKREEANDDDRRRQREDRRLLGSPRDEIAGGGHQRDPEANGERPEQQRERHPAAGHAGKPEQATDRRSRDGLAPRAPIADDPVGALCELGTVRDEHEPSCPLATRRPRRRRSRRSRDPGRPSARRAAPAARRAGTRAQARPVASHPPRAAVLRRRPPSRIRREAR